MDITKDELSVLNEAARMLHAICSGLRTKRRLGKITPDEEVLIDQIADKKMMIDAVLLSIDCRERGL